MKKTSILFFVTIVAMSFMVSCKKNEAKKSTLANEADSINYALGLANGGALKQYYMTDVTNEDGAVNAFIQALDKSFSSTEEPDELKQLGSQIGASFKHQEKEGLWGNPDLKFNYALVKQGMEDAMNGTEGGMTAIEAQTYIQTTMQKIQQEKVPAEVIEEDSIEVE